MIHFNNLIKNFLSNLKYFKISYLLIIIIYNIN